MTPSHDKSGERKAVLDAIETPAGMLEYGCRTAIRDLIRLHGFDEARELVAMYLTDEAERTRQ